MLLELTGDGIIDGLNAGQGRTGIFLDVVLVETQNPPFYGIHFVEVLRLDIFGHGLRHTAYNHILAEVVHCISMEVTHGLLLFKLLLDVGHQHLVSHSPEELLKIHRIHVDTFFFRRYDNVLHVFFDGNERACFQIVETVVGDQRFDGFSGTGTFLHFVEDDERLAWRECLFVMELYVLKECVHILQIFIEPGLDSGRCFAEVNHDIGVVLVAGKLLGDIAFSDTSGTLNEQSSSTILLLLPLD